MSFKIKIKNYLIVTVWICKLTINETFNQF